MTITCPKCNGTDVVTSNGVTATCRDCMRPFIVNHNAMVKAALKPMPDPTIHVDDPMPHPGKFNNYCHMWADGTADTLDELDAFAKRLGLRVEWRQFTKGITGDFYHYDISPSKRAKALKIGAEYISLADWLRPKWDAYNVANGVAKRNGVTKR